MVYISLIVACGFYFEKRLALAQGIMAVGASIGELPTFTQAYGLLWQIFTILNNHEVTEKNDLKL